MGTEVSWDNYEQTIARFQYSDTWSWDDCHRCAQLGKVMANSVSHPVTFIVDMRDSQAMPPNPMRHMRLMVSQVRKQHQKSIFVFVGADDFVRAICSAIYRIYLDVRAFAEFHFVDTLDEARTLAHQHQKYLAAKHFGDTQPIG